MYVCVCVVALSLTYTDTQIHAHIHRSTHTLSARVNLLSLKVHNSPTYVNVVGVDVVGTHLRGNVT